MRGRSAWARDLSKSLWACWLAEERKDAKKALTLVAVGAMFALLAIPAASYLQIDSPVSATIDIDSYGTGSSAMDIIDNTGTGTGAKCAYLDSNTNDFRIDFSGSSHGGIIVSRNQEVQFGDSGDWVFQLKNTSGQQLDVDIVCAKGQGLPDGVLIKFVEKPLDHAGKETTGEDNSFTIFGDNTEPIGGAASGNFVTTGDKVNIDPIMSDGEVIQFHIIVKTDNASAANPTWNWTIRAVGS